MTALLGQLGSLGAIVGGSVGRLVVSGMILAMGVTTVVTVGTGALFTDTQSVGANAFTTGTLDIASSPTTALLTASGMAPGDKAEAPVTVSNNGSLQLRYAIQRSADNTDSKGLRDSMRLRIGVRGGAGCDFPYYNAAGTAQALSDDTQLYEGLGFPGTATNTVGDATTGGQSGDRSLNASSNEVLCFSVVLPSSAGNALQGATTTATFDLVSEQTTNN